MMIFLRLLPVILSTLLLSAHFLRAQNFIFALILLLLPFLLLAKKVWAARTIQTILFFGAFEWLRTLITIAIIRNAMNESWGRMAIILGSVALLTAASALIFSYNESIKKRYGLTKDLENVTN